MGCHEAIDVMGDAVEGRLDPRLRPSFDEHLGECRPCATYMEHLRITRQALKRLPGETGTSPNRKELLAEFRREFRRDPD